MLKIKNLHTYFNQDDQIIRAVDGIDITVGQGEIICVVGESGCGKTVTALSLTRLLHDTNTCLHDGEVVFHGEDLLQISENELRVIRGKEISYIFQEPQSSLNPVLTIADQMIEPLMLHNNMTKKQAIDRAIELLTMCDIEEPEKRIYSYPHELSGGMKQRVMIAMAISTNPKLLIADEPTTSLDVTIQKEILDLLFRIRRDIKLSILFITHDLSIVKYIADRVYIMYLGKVVESASSTELLENPLHPYTKGLLQCIPEPGHNKEKLFSIEGVVPHPVIDWKQCRFYDRCKVCEERCLESEPQLVEVDEDHWVRCIKNRCKG